MGPKKKKRSLTIRVISDKKKKTIVKAKVEKKNVLLKGVKSLKISQYITKSQSSDTTVGNGFPSTLRTLKKDVQFVKKQYPSLSVDLIEQVLIDTIPKEEHIPSTCADLTKAMNILQSIHTSQLKERKGSLRH